MIIAYRYGSLSVLQPMLSLNYVLSIIMAAFVLKEQINLSKCIGSGIKKVKVKPLAFH